MDLGHLSLDRPRAHPLLPVGVIAVEHHKRDRPAQCAAVANTPGELNLIALDLHPASPPVAELAAGQVAIQRRAVELEAGRKPLDDARQAGAVRLSGCGHPQRHQA